MIRSAVDRINPFNALSLNVLDSAINNLAQHWDIQNKLNTISNIAGSQHFHGIVDSFTTVAVICFRAFFSLVSGTITQAANRTELLERSLPGDGYAALQRLMEDKNELSIGDTLLSIKAEAVDEPLAKCDAYLNSKVQHNGQWYKDISSEARVYSFIDHDRRYELLPCYLNPSVDVGSHFFRRGPEISWLSASIAALVHHHVMTEQAVSLGIIKSSQMVKATFTPVVSESWYGSCRVSLFPNCYDNAPVTYNIDTRLPVLKATMQNINHIDLSALPQSILEYVKNKILAPSHQFFSAAHLNSGSWALVEKTVVCNLGANRSRKENIGTGVHMLSGMKTGFCFKKAVTNRWTVHSVSFDRRNWNEKFDRVTDHLHIIPNIPHFTDQQLLAHIRSRTLSFEGQNILETEAADTISEEAKSKIQKEMNNISMFIIQENNPQRISHPVISHDDTSEENPVYSNGVVIQPLMDLLKYNEVWEYPITSPIDAGEIKPQTISSTRGFMSFSSDISESRVNTSKVTARSGVLDEPHTMATTSRSSPKGMEDLFKEMTQRIRGFDVIQSIVTEPVLLLMNRSFKVHDIVQYQVPKKGDEIGKIENIIQHKDKEKRVTYKYVVRSLAGDKFLGKVRDFQKSKISQVSDFSLLTLDLARAENRFTNHSQTRRINPQCDRNRIPEWGMTLAQFREYIRYCKKYKILWNRCKENDKTEFLPANKGFVNAYDMDNCFIKNQTQGSGMGVALNMQRVGFANTPGTKRSQVMLSHAWGEDMEKVLELLEGQKNSLTLSDGGKLNDNTVLWFCVFSNFQANSKGREESDRLGPTVNEIVRWDAFEKVIQNVNDMIVLQTCTADPYSRFWCVVELAEAMQQSKTRKFEIHPLFDKNWLSGFVGGDSIRHWYQVNNYYTGETQWRSSLEKVGEDKLNRNPDGESQSLRLTQRKNSGKTVYRLFSQNETRKITQEEIQKMKKGVKNSHELPVDVGEEWPILRIEIRLSITGDGASLDKYCKMCLAATNGVSEIDDKKRAVNKYWMEIQNKIAQFQEDKGLSAAQTST